MRKINPVGAISNVVKGGVKGTKKVVIDVPYSVIEDARYALTVGRPGTKRNKLKVPVKGQSPHIESRLKDFGTPVWLIERAFKGDLKACKVLGEKGRQGRWASSIAPLVAEKVKETVNGTVAMNKAWADIYEATGRGSNDLDKAANKAEIQELKYVQNDKEIKAAHKVSKELHKIRSQYADASLALNGALDKEIAEVDGNYKLLNAQLRVEEKQLTEDEKHKTETVTHYLNHGANSRMDLKPKKEYPNAERVREIKASVKDYLFGF